jgi:hypothetical protein
MERASVVVLASIQREGGPRRRRPRKPLQARRLAFLPNPILVSRVLEHVTL